MTDISTSFQEAFDPLYKLSNQNKVLFLDLLNFAFTVSVRAIWSDEQPSGKDKLEAFKWLNELNHRIWNIRFDIKNGIENDSIERLYENMKFYGEQSALLQSHLAPAFLSAFEQFKNMRQSA